MGSSMATATAGPAYADWQAPAEVLEWDSPAPPQAAGFTPASRCIGRYVTPDMEPNARKHTAVAGITGDGKTTTMNSLLVADIAVGAQCVVCSTHFTYYHPDDQRIDLRPLRDAGLLPADVALSIQSQAPCGWAQDSSLSAAQKIWLDRQYLAPLEQVDTPEQQALLDLMHREEWQQQIAKDFGGWLNVQLRSVIDDLDDAEKRVWAVYYFADTLNAMWGDAA